MVRLMFAALVVVAGCKDKQQPARTEVASGSQQPVAMNDAPIADAARDELSTRYEACLAHANAGRWDDFKRCYVPGVMFEAPGLDKPRGLDIEVEAAKKARGELPDYTQTPQLVLASGNTLIAIELHTATSKKTSQPVAVLLGHVIVADATGAFTRDLAFWDVKTVEAQRTGKPGFRALAAPLPAKISLVAKDDEIEKANLATFTQMMDASEAKDLVTFGDKLADDITWAVQNRAADLGKAEILAGIQVRLEKTDLHYRVDHAWAAGDYVAAIETVFGTATADAPDKTFKKGDKIERQLLAVHRFANGKLTQVWVFAQG